MTIMTKVLAGGMGLAALATAAPSAAQYGYGNPYAYGNQYGGMNTQVAAQRCAAAVQSRLSTRSGGISGILGALVGANTNTGRVISVTQAVPRNNYVRVRGLASSGRMAGYGPYGAGAYGALAYSYQPDLSFKCDVDYRGYVRNVDINRRR
ncbi:MAG: hypothetical protein ABI422_05060 [Sphingomicrobium sp.]